MVALWSVILVSQVVGVALSVSVIAKYKCKVQQPPFSQNTPGRPPTAQTPGIPVCNSLSLVGGWLAPSPQLCPEAVTHSSLWQTRPGLHWTALMSPTVRPHLWNHRCECVHAGLGGSKKTKKSVFYADLGNAHSESNIPSTIVILLVDRYTTYSQSQNTSSKIQKKK